MPRFPPRPPQPGTRRHRPAPAPALALAGSPATQAARARLPLPLRWHVSTHHPSPTHGSVRSPFFWRGGADAQRGAGSHPRPHSRSRGAAWTGEEVVLASWGRGSKAAQTGAPNGRHVSSQPRRPDGELSARRPQCLPRPASGPPQSPHLSVSESPSSSEDLSPWPGPALPQHDLVFTARQGHRQSDGTVMGTRAQGCAGLRPQLAGTATFSLCDSSPF